jgi:4-hydroxybenzoate polyprenyltransferase
MGLCRGTNLLLGISIVTSSLADRWFIAIIPVIYIAAVTTVSRGEVHGSNNRALKIAGILYGVVLLCIGVLGLFPYFYLRSSLVFIVLFAMMIYGPLRKAEYTGIPQDIGKAVKAGVLGLILMDTAIAAGFLGWDYALLVVCLLPVSVVLARVFAVT